MGLALSACGTGGIDWDVAEAPANAPAAEQTGSKVVKPIESQPR